MPPLSHLPKYYLHQLQAYTKREWSTQGDQSKFKHDEEFESKLARAMQAQTHLPKSNKVKAKL